MRRTLGSIAVLLMLLVIVVPVAVAKPNTPKGPPPVEVQLLAVNDFHGNLEPPSGSSGRITDPASPTGSFDAGGVEYLATHIRRLEATNKNTVVVSAGDLIGASPLISALFHDEPTIEAFNKLGLDFNAVGNHEFDEGLTELLRMQEGGCHPTDGCLDGDPFAGAEFGFLAANVVYADTGEPIFPAYEIRNFQGVKVAFIGMTLEGTASIVTPTGIQGLEFLDEADTVNALVPELRKKNVEAIVVLLHEGGSPTGLYNECPGISGPIVDIATRMDDAVDLIVSGHTHQAYNCVIDGTVVTSAASFGRIVTDIDLTLDRRTKDVTSISANNVIVKRDVPKAPDLTALVDKYRTLSAPLSNRVIGSITSDLTRAANPAGESSLGDIIADAQLYATSPASLGGAVVAFMNPGGIRADFTFEQSGSEGAGNVTYGEAFTVQPFSNDLVTLTLTGAQIDTLLEQQWLNQASPKILQVSEGFTYAYSASAESGEKVDPASIMIDGVVVDPAATYRVTVNSFLAAGGDGFTVLPQGTDQLVGVVDLDALVAYFEELSPIDPGPQSRITRLP